MEEVQVKGSLFGEMMPGSFPQELTESIAFKRGRELCREHWMPPLLSRLIQRIPNLRAS